MSNPTDDVLDTNFFAYSEWLDSQGLIISDRDEGADKRTHEELVKAFLAQDVSR